MRVVFMGTPDISAVCLEKLLAQHFSVVGVYTKPDAPQNRGMRLAQSPVKKVALAAGLPVFQPERLRDPETVQTLRDLHPDVIAVVAYGKILPPEVLEIPPRGCINIHASILSALRGSGPVQWAILQGMTETGIPRSAQRRTRSSPGSLIPGIPASVTSAHASPLSMRAQMISPRSRLLCSK